MASEQRTAASLASLHPRIYPLAYYHLVLLRYYGLPAVVTEGRRSLSRQVMLVSQGKSRTYKSKHLQGLAYDLWFDVPYAPPRSWWAFAGQVGEWLGLRWGGRFKGFVDMPHFEL